MKYANIAFISYKREDETWAKWLQKKLEHYKLPTEIRKKNPNLDFSECPRCVFKDTTDLSGGVLAKAIKAGLESSKYLIVICSPRAARSEWVCREVQSFIDLGREENIIPFIIEGVPYSKNEEAECFPDTLKLLATEKELLGINVNEIGREAAVVKVIATMFGLRFDVLWQRFRREEKRKKQIYTLFLILICVTSIIIGYYFYYQKKIIQEQHYKLVETTDKLRDYSQKLTLHMNQIQRDSILLEQQKDSIKEKNTRLIKSLNDLEYANRKLVIEKRNTLEANSRLIAERASLLVDEGDTYNAMKLTLELFNGMYPFTIDSEIALRKASNGKNIILEGHNRGVHSLCHTTDGNYIASGGFDNVIRIWNVNNGKCCYSLEGHKGDILALDYNRDGNFLASGSTDNSIKIWDVSNGTCIKTIYGHKDYVSSVEFSPNGKYIASGSGDNSIKIWDYANGKCLKTLVGHTDYVNTICYNNDGSFLASGGYDGKVKVWDLIKATCIKTMDINARSVENVAFSLDSKYVISSGSDNIINLSSG